MMKRIVVIGCIGAGKSVFSEKLSRITGIKLCSLDRLFVETGGIRADRNDWRRAQEEITSMDSWIIEGNYGATIDLRLKRADSVIFMDFPTAKCVAGFLRRVIASKLGLKTGSDIVEGCNSGFDMKLLHYAWTFNRKHRKGIINGLARYSNIRLVTIRSRKEAERFLRDAAAPKN